MTEKNGELKCEGGKLECSGHRVQACVIDKDRDDVVKYLGNIAVCSTSCYKCPTLARQLKLAVVLSVH